MTDLLLNEKTVHFGESRNATKMVTYSPGLLVTIKEMSYCVKRAILSRSYSGMLVIFRELIGVEVKRHRTLQFPKIRKVHFVHLLS